MQGEIQAGQLVEISTSEVLSSTKDPPAWRVHQITDRYSENLGDVNTKLENSGHARIPKADAKPMPLPVDSCQTNEAFTWKARFGEHCNKYSAEAYQIFCTFEIKYPMVPKPKILAKQMTKMGFDEKDLPQRKTLKYVFKNGRLRTYQVLLKIVHIMRLSNGLQLS